MGTGVVIAVIGLLAVLTPLVTGIGLSILLGTFLILGGLVHVANAFSARGWTASLWQIVLGIVYAVAGISLLANPILGLVTVTVLVIVYLAVGGVIEIVMGLSMRSEPRWGWLVLSGIVSLVLAGMLWTGIPSSAFWVVGLLFGVSLLSTGLSLVGIALVGRRAATTGEPEASGAGSPGA